MEHKYPAPALKSGHLKGKDFNFFSLVSRFHPRVNGVEFRYRGMGTDDEGPESRFSLQEEADENTEIEIDELDIHAAPVDKAYPSRLINCNEYCEKEEVRKTEFLITTDLFEAARRMKRVARDVGYTGNEGCSFMLRYMHGAIFIPISGTKNTDPYTIEHTNRRFELEHYL
eukprot:Phypoly_transcript_19015.p1 GENE.Phypoly_transcript_19015~~Phypoly_transcript_19015.p1  ORF type:complete len:194 (+),score=35.96 Phypoly_transcript_19015:71-583(+)